MHWRRLRITNKTKEGLCKQPLLSKSGIQLFVPPVGHRGYIEKAFEHAVKIGLAGKAHLVHDILHFHISSFDQLCGITDARFGEIVVEVIACLLFENGAQIGRGHIQAGGQGF